MLARNAMMLARCAAGIAPAPNNWATTTKDPKPNSTATSLATPKIRLALLIAAFRASDCISKSTWLPRAPSSANNVTTSRGQVSARRLRRVKTGGLVLMRLAFKKGR